MLPLEKEYLDYIDNLEIGVEDLPGELPMMAKFVERLAPGYGVKVTIALAQKYIGIRYKWPSLRYISKEIRSYLEGHKDQLVDDDALPYGRDDLNYQMLELFAGTINEVLPGKGLHLVLLLSRAFAGGDTRWHNVKWFFASHRKAWILNRYDADPPVTVRELAIATGLSQGMIEKIIAKGPENNMQLTLPWC